MGTGTYQEINLRITGSINFDYEDTAYAPDVFRKELELLCVKYGLEVEDNEIQEIG